MWPVLYASQALLLRWLLISISLVSLSGSEQRGAKYIHTPMHEIAQTELYLTINDNHEVIVSYAGKGVDLRPNDYITHADGVRILTGKPGGLEEFLRSGEKEAVVPIVDDDDTKFGGQRFKGFMLLQAVQPRKLVSRRGEVFYDMEEGGPAPSMKLGNIVIGAGGAKTTTDPSYVPPPHGGGACISRRDCFPVPGGAGLTGGSCVEGQCACAGDYTGTYCQLHRPEYAAVSLLVKKAADAAAAGASVGAAGADASGKRPPIVPAKEADSAQPPPATPDGPSLRGTSTGDGEQPVKKEPIKLTVGAKQAPAAAAADVPASAAPVTQNQPSGPPAAQPSFAAMPTAAMQDRVTATSAGNSCTPTSAPTAADVVPEPEKASAVTQRAVPAEEAPPTQTQQAAAPEPVTAPEEDEQGRGSAAGSGESAQPKKGMRRRRKPGAGGGGAAGEDGEGGGGAADGAPRRVVTGAGDVMDQQREKSLTMDDLYGEGKAYPEPYNAGKLPNNLVHERYRKRYNRESFIYSVRFRVGPFGITFDNKITNGTIVQSLVRGEQAEQSDIKEGDQLIAVDHFNTSDAPAKITQRIMGGLSWPRVLVFQTRVTGADPREKDMQLRRRTFNLTIVYPPTLVGEYQFRLAEWAPALAPLLTAPTHPLLLNHPAFAEGAPPADFCPVYRIRAAADAFGCAPEGTQELALPGAFDEMVDRKGVVNHEAERGGQMLAMLLQEAHSREIHIEPRSLGIVKRGVCTFVQKAHALQNAGANLAIVVNNANELSDMPAGKEKTDRLQMPIGLSTENDALLTHLAASNDNEIWAIVSESGIPAAVQPVAAAQPVTPVPATPAGKVGKGGRNTRAAANAPKTKAAPVVAPVSAEIVYESGGMTAACGRVQALVEDIIDRFPHTVPPMDTRAVLKSVAPDSGKIRGLTEEGGRMALSGQNGWAFFDYHLAMFGPQEVPLGPFRLQMALPPFGCDPGAYTVRIQGAVVAILRGGGCSFGIKVINAQKLGAKAVIIVNTDDMKTMRLMALPDEVPLITIPCIMVSRRIQYYLEEQLRPYHPIDQHLVSIQPTGVFGEYEKRNELALPERLKIH